MKVLQINESDSHGGAARAAIRLHESLLSVGVESVFFAAQKKSDGQYVIGPKGKVSKAISMAMPALESFVPKTLGYEPQAFFSTGMLGFNRLEEIIKKVNPDIIHLHWINNGFISLRDIRRLKRPTIWTMHDMWPFTGGCHYSMSCKKFTSSCGKCPALGSEKLKDLSSRIQSSKRKLGNNITYNALSKWLYHEALSSDVLKDQRVVNLPNAINTEFYKPIDRGFSKSMLGIEENTLCIAFGAMGVTSDPRKGYRELSLALQEVKSEDKVTLLVFGSSEVETHKSELYETIFLGDLHDDLSMLVIYNAADVLVVPSIQENLSNVIMESLSCGTPVVGFNIGGNSDLIDHGINGYLASVEDPTTIWEGVKEVIANHKKYSIAARDKVESSFSYSKIGKAYKKLYKSLIN